MQQEKHQIQHFVSSTILWVHSERKKKKPVKSLNINLKKTLVLYSKRHQFYFFVCWNVITGVKHRMLMK